MHTTKSLISDLNQMGIEPTDTLLIHSSMKSIGETENGADTVINALCEHMSNGLLVMPAHTWSYINAENPVFDVRNSNTCVGIISERFRGHKDVIRSLHPTHSLSAFGKEAGGFLIGQELFDTPCAPNSCYGKLLKSDAKVLLLGVDFSKNTLVHCIEEIAQVPKRLSDKNEELFVIDYNGRKIAVPSFRHENSDSYFFRKLEPVMISHGLVKAVNFGDAKCMLFSAGDLFNVTLQLLNINIRLFDDLTPIPEETIQLLKLN